MSRQGLLEHKNRLHGKVGLAHITRLRSFEIDEPEDMSLAEHHFQWLKQNRHITE
jgi:CMP-N-acetylneuraminic acid synthetase